MELGGSLNAHSWICSPSRYVTERALNARDRCMWAAKDATKQDEVYVKGGMFPLSTLNVRLLATLLNGDLGAYYQKAPGCHEKIRGCLCFLKEYLHERKSSRCLPE